MDTRIHSLDMLIRTYNLDTRRIQRQDTLAYPTYGFAPPSEYGVSTIPLVVA